jgi:predicted DNA-binding protein (UPF0251 family)
MTVTPEKRDQRPLSPVSRRALEDEAYRLHVEEARTYGGVAENMGCSRRTAIRRVARAEARMARRLQSTTAQVRARQEQRYEALLARAWPQDGDAPTPKEVANILSILSRIDRLWGLDRNPPIEPAASVYARRATITQLDPATTRALLGRDPIPLPGPDPIELEAPLHARGFVPS